MKLWLIRPTDEGAAEWRNWHNCMFGFVVRAENESAARIEASKQAGDEGPGAWVQRKMSRCEELSPLGPPGVILSDYNRPQ